MAEIGKNIELAAELLTQGKLVAIPTETVYGLAALATNEKAVLSIYEAKSRPHFDPLIIHLPHESFIEKYANLSHPSLKALAEAFWPGPLTLLLPKTKLIPDLVTSGLSQVAVRVPAHPITLQLLRKLNAPLAAPSANPFGYISPTEAHHVKKQLGKKVDYILDGGISLVGIESTIVGLENNKACIYRLGGLSIEAIEKVIGPVELRINQSGDPRAPGQLKSHYAPTKPLFFGDIAYLYSHYKDESISMICFGESGLETTERLKIYNLSPGGDFKEAALQLFKFLRLADEDNSSLIICQKLPDVDLGRAINDRLLRASSRSISNQ